ncbi:MAG: hypothetical protein ACYDCH_09635 [Gaiellaceae bacterium]
MADRQDKPDLYALLRRWNQPDGAGLTFWETNRLLKAAGEADFFLELRDREGRPVHVADYERESSVAQVGAAVKAPPLRTQVHAGSPITREVIAVTHRVDRRLTTTELALLIAAEIHRRRSAGIDDARYKQLLHEVGPDFETCEPRLRLQRVRQWRHRAQDAPVQSTREIADDWKQARVEAGPEG